MGAWLLLACLVAFATRLAGYRVPSRWLESPRKNRGADAQAIGLLAALTAMNTVAGSHGLMLKARIGALLMAALAL
ncbi:MAG: AzlD domain-containing protein [Xanthomonadales bacterium]|nr:AzlD domain-containing protein [Xanthomonadales bacterium]